MNMKKLIDSVFIFSAIIFNITVSFLYIATKLSNTAILQVTGAIVISLIIPFTITLIGHLKEKVKKRIIIPHTIILFYLFLELTLDYILRIPFREIYAFHVPYIIIFYAALFSMISISFDKNRKMAYVVIITFLTLIGCLIYYLLPF